MSVSAKRPRTASADYPDYAIVGYLHDGRFAAIAAAIAVLHGGGWVGAGQHGTVRRNEDAHGSPSPGFEKTVWLAIHGFVSPGALSARPSVDTLLNELRRRCHALGLIHSFVPVRGFTPARTHAGRELIAAAHRDCPWPPSPEASRDLAERFGMPVALHGNDALKRLMPDFARDSGLLRRRGKDGLDWADPQAPGAEGRYF
jgi:hypothetical protein